MKKVQRVWNLFSQIGEVPTNKKRKVHVYEVPTNKMHFIKLIILGVHFAIFLVFNHIDAERNLLVE
jgi:hypothetical protein